MLLLQNKTNLVAHVLDHDVLQALVQLVPVLVQHHGVRVPVQLLERQPAVVLLLYFLDGLLQQRPDVRHVLVVHRHLLSDVTVISFVLFYEWNVQRFDVNDTFYLHSLKLLRNDKNWWKYKPNIVIFIVYIKNTLLSLSFNGNKFV